jgi:DNA-binding GntR family transcriptional regulator
VTPDALAGDRTGDRTGGRTGDRAVGASLSEAGFSRPSTSQMVAQVIREQILRGEIAPGSRLSDETIAGALGVSRNSVREGLQILVAAGLVQRELHRGAVVTELSQDELADVYQARRTIEMDGIRGARTAGPAWLETLRRVLAELKAAADSGDQDRLLEADLRFHEAIVESIGSRRVSRFYRDVQTEIRLARTWRGEWPEPPVFYERHREVVDALDEGDFGRAEELVARLIDDGQRRVGAGERGDRPH